YFSCLIECICNHRDLLSFPTRRSSDLLADIGMGSGVHEGDLPILDVPVEQLGFGALPVQNEVVGKALVVMEEIILDCIGPVIQRDRKSTRLNSSHVKISYAVFCLKK